MQKQIFVIREELLWLLVDLFEINAKAIRPSDSEHEKILLIRP